MDEIIYFNVNNWFAGRDYPICQPIAAWVNESKFNDDQWCKDNKLCVLAGTIDMSENWCITAPIAWVQSNFPQLLTDEHYTYTLLVHRGGSEPEKRDYDKAYSDFRRYPDEDGEVEGQFGWMFLEYTEDNFGVTWYEDDWSESDDSDEEDDD